MQTRREVLTSMLAAGAAAPALLTGASAFAAPVPALKEAFKDDFLVGAALNTAQAAGHSRSNPLIEAQFNAIAPENCLKWEYVHPLPDKYDFSDADTYVDYGARHGMFAVGHVLIWHNQTPAWVFRDGNGGMLDRDSLLARMRDHIHAVVGRYRGRIGSWDVINEPIDEDGSMRKTLWYRIVGEDYVAKAFQFAREADPDALLLYNDYSIESPAKRKGADALIAKLKAEGAPITSVGLQGHYNLNFPSLDELDDTIADFEKMGLKVPMTELDIDVLPAATNTADVAFRMGQDPALNPYAGGLPDEVQDRLAQRYADVFRILVRHRGVVDRVTFWGVTDGDSWKNNWPVRGRTNYPLLFDRAYQPKPAFYAVIKEAAA